MNAAARRVALRTARVARIVLPLVATCIAATAAALPDPLVERSRFVQPADSVAVVDRHGAVLRKLSAAGADRHWVPLSRISQDVVVAVIAVEDQRFRTHAGLDPLAMSRALLQDVLPGARLSGASTITEQLVKLVYGRENGIASKGTEMARAVALERVMTKDEILEQYLNRLPYGNGIVGVERASEVYFGRPAAELGLSEAALLAGIPQAPSATEPLRHLRRALARRRTVLERVRGTRMRSDADVDRALADVPHVLGTPPRPWRAPRFADRVTSMEHDGTLRAQAGTIATSLDLPLQGAAEDVLRDATVRLASRGATNGAAIVVRNATGEVLAYVGAAHEEAGGGALDLVRARRRPGSALKPFVYELYFERGGTAASVLDDTMRPMTGADGALFAARDYDGEERGPVRARVALASSLNLAAVDAARKVGAERLVARLSALGVRDVGSADELGAAVVLGGLDVSPWELATAYATLARGGTRVPLVLVPTYEVAGARVMDPGAAAVTRSVLEDARARADAFGGSLEPVAHGPFALKTGTSTGWHDAWSAAFDDDFTVVVWLGDPDGRAMAGVSGFEGAAPLAASILAAARARRDAIGESAAAEPVSLESAAVCAVTGLLPGAHCHDVVVERFAPGTAPTAPCTAHGEDGTVALSARYADWLARARPAGYALAPSAPSAAAVLRVASPATGAVLYVDRAREPPRIPLRAALDGAETADARWELDGVALAEPRATLSPGAHVLVARIGSLRSAPSRFEVR